MTDAKLATMPEKIDNEEEWETVTDSEEEPVLCKRSNKLPKRVQKLRLVPKLRIKALAEEALLTKLPFRRLARAFTFN